jgi:hypothetical protein
MALLDMMEEKSFLGPEFATWLWYRSEQKEGAISLPDGKSCEVGFEKDLVLASPAGEALNSALRGDAPSLAPEAAAALAAGKKVKRARIRLTAKEVTYELVLNAETLDWTGLKIETPPSLPFEEAVPLRLTALDEFAELFEALFAAFLDLRLDPDRWAGEVKRVRKWIAAKVERTEEDGS